MAIESEIGVGKRHPSVPDSELLRRIAHHMRSLYADVIRQPLPRNIEDALLRIDRSSAVPPVGCSRLGPEPSSDGLVRYWPEARVPGKQTPQGPQRRSKQPLGDGCGS